MVENNLHIQALTSLSGHYIVCSILTIVISSLYEPYLAVYGLN